MLELLTARAPDLEVVPGQTLSFPANISFRGPRQLWLQRGISGPEPEPVARPDTDMGPPTQQRPR